MEYPWFSSYDEGVPQNIDVKQYSSIVELFEESEKTFATLPAFHCMGKTYTYNEIGSLSRKFSIYLKKHLQLKKGDRLAIMMPNILQYPIALLGALKAELVVVNVNPLYTARELQHQLQDSGAKTIVIFENACHVLESVIEKTSVEHVITTQIGDFLDFPKSLLVNFVVKRIKGMVPSWNLPRSVNFKEAVFSSNESLYETPQTTLEDIAFLQYTGGTTGTAKGAMLTHQNICANIIQARAWIKIFLEEGKEIMITPLPLYHIFSLTANCFIFSSIGALNVLITNPRDIKNFVKELGQWKFTAITGVNTLFNALLNNSDFKKLDFSNLKISLGGGMAVQKSVAEKWKEITKIPLIEAYGLTETSPAACINPMTLKDYNGKIGLPIPSTIVTVKDDNGNDLPMGQKGELCIKGPQVMKGYWNCPKETEGVMIGDGFLKTGDIAFMDERGFLQIIDRKKDMILVSGFNVYPGEIEDVLVSHSKVFEAAAIGVPDEKSGEGVKVYIVKKDESLTIDEVKDHCKKYLTGYKIPKHYEFRKSLPKSNVGKILRKDLRDQTVSTKSS